MSLVIGIDFGTTNSVAAVVIDGKAETVPDFLGARTTPSVVAFTGNTIIIGKRAKDKLAKNAPNTLSCIKRFIGKKVEDIQEDLKDLPFKVVPAKKRMIQMEVEYKGETTLFSPEEISAMILRQLKDDAERHFTKAVKKAVITVPACFNDSQREATKNAGKIAGLEVLQLINAPTAAAVAYAYTQKISSTAENILVVDLGGGTFDVTILTFEENVLKVRSTRGDTHLGGEDLTNKMVKHLVDIHKAQKGVDIASNQRALCRLHEKVEIMKRNLSESTKDDTQIDSLIGDEDFEATITRTDFDHIWDEFFNRTMMIVESAIKDSGISKDMIQKILLVGGSTRIPRIKKMLTEYFEGREIYQCVNQDEVVAHGAAIVAAQLSKTIPATIELSDVIPLSLGIGVRGGIVQRIVTRNTVIPLDKSKPFTTSEDYQTIVAFEVFQGEREKCCDNVLIGVVTLENIVPAPRGVAKFNVNFHVDANGIITVSAKFVATGIQKEIQMKKCHLSDAEIAIKIQEARKREAEDKAYRKLLCANNEFLGLCYEIQNAIKTDAFKTAESGKIQEIQQKLAENFQACKNESVQITDIEYRKAELKSLYDRVATSILNGNHAGNGC